MKLKFLIDEDFVNYKKPSMVVGFPFCGMKCNVDCGKEVCHNTPLTEEPIIDMDVDHICERYLTNPMTAAIVMQGFEPLDSSFELIELIDALRTKNGCKDDIVIFTGYTEEECNGEHDKVYENVNFEKVHAVYKQLQQYENIIVKFGRYIPGNEPHPDELLGVALASDNQYAKFIGKPISYDLPEH